MTLAEVGDSPNLKGMLPTPGPVSPLYYVLSSLYLGQTLFLVGCLG